MKKTAAGRPPAPACLTNNVLQANVLQTFECTLKDIYDCMRDDVQWLLWLAEHHVIRNNNDCATYRRPMSLARRAELPGGYS